jgi:hypothetical protein
MNEFLGVTPCVAMLQLLIDPVEELLDQRAA